MAHVEESQTEGEGSLKMISLRSETSGNHVDDGEVAPSMRKKRRKKKDPRPESIIVYRSEMERAPGEDQGGEEGAERSSEEGAKFLCTPTGEGERGVRFCSEETSIFYITEEKLLCNVLQINCILKEI